MNVYVCLPTPALQILYGPTWSRLHSAVSHCDQPDKLWKALAAELCGGSCGRILLDWARRLGRKTVGSVWMGQLILPRKSVRLIHPMNNDSTYTDSLTHSAS